jgi:hypothetical protein
MGAPSPVSRVQPPLAVPAKHSGALPGIYRDSLHGAEATLQSASTLGSIAANEVVKVLQQHVATIHGVKVKTFSPSFIHYIVSLHDPADLETKSSIYGKISELESVLRIRIKVQFTRAEHMEAYEGVTLVL